MNKYFKICLCYSDGSVTELDQDEMIIGNGQSQNEGNIHEMDTLDNGTNGISSSSNNNNNNNESIGRTPSTDEPESNAINESEAQISERAATGYNDTPGQGSPRVQFEKIQEESGDVGQHSESLTEEDRKIRRHHKHDHK